MENRKQETENSKPVTTVSGFPFPVSGFLFFILLALRGGTRMLAIASRRGEP
jgi:hypothetical protein